jgi:purine-nucleoside/S-methyl-5'-thioadenosine phosphorylase / adenosine deaminase
MSRKSEIAEGREIGAVDELLAGVGLKHGRRLIRRDSPRYRRQEPAELQETPPTELATHRQGRVEVLVVPGWQKAHVPHAFSTRRGGVSTAYSGGEESPAVDSAALTAGEMSRGEMNLGLTDSDEAANVLENRRLLMAAAGAEGRKLVTLKQIHSNLTRRVTRADADRTMLADGLMTDDPEVMLGIQTADCVPVLVRDRRTGAAAAFHAGWRGTLKRIVEGGIGKMRLEFGSRPEELEAAIGPAIGACCYAVGEEVKSEFLSQFSYVPELFSEIYDSDPVKEKYPLLFLTARAPGHSNIWPNLHLDLIEANRRQLIDAGLRAESIWTAYRCTNCEPEMFYSYRAERGFCGRMMGVIGAG